MRRTHFTVLLVCEGDAEDQFARVIRDIYLPRNCGTVLQRKNAHGSGGMGTLNLALRLQRETGHDAYGLLIDTDDHWTDGDRTRAQQAGIIVVENTPSIEATLLKVDGQKAHPLTRENKATFENLYGGPAHREGVIERYFTRDKFDNARKRVSPIDILLTLIRC